MAFGGCVRKMCWPDGYPAHFCGLVPLPIQRRLWRHQAEPATTQLLEAGAVTLQDRKGNLPILGRPLRSLGKSRSALQGNAVPQADALSASKLRFSVLLI